MKKQVIITYTSLSVGWLLLMIAIFSIILSGCTRDNITGSGNIVSEIRPTGPFTDVEVSGPFEVHLLQENTSAVELRAEDNIIGAIETGIHNNSLFVRMRNNVNIRRHKPIKIYVHNPIYQRVKFDGSGSLDNKDTLRTSLFKYELNGDSDASLLLAANDLNTTINGSGNIALKGSANSIDSDINGDGNIAAINMEVQNANITIRGSGEHTILVRKHLDARIYGSGNIYYSGNPGITLDVKGSGHVIKQ
ncbi:head GIN domain-containing protein [Chitinophaga sp. 212800010-3]|uniref:head GIN domain-containing protein n=1 Tax=unclassified Chitinophaga TaxID=2619133 RepID=UPI002DE9BF30|nr:DUF2807 domain-containing protein [Chitinophaga sp. 212800010-3]